MTDYNCHQENLKNTEHRNDLKKAQHTTKPKSKRAESTIFENTTPKKTP